MMLRAIYYPTTRVGKRNAPKGFPPHTVMLGAPSRQAPCLALVAPLLIILLTTTGVSSTCVEDDNCVGCSDENSNKCVQMAYCSQEPLDATTSYCECQPDLWGDGAGAGDGCQPEAAVASISFKIGDAWDGGIVDITNDGWVRLNEASYVTVMGDFTSAFMAGLTNAPQWYFSYRITGTGTGKWISLNVLVKDLATADQLLLDWAGTTNAGKALSRTLTATDGVVINGITLFQDADLSFSPDELDGIACGVELLDGYMPIEPRAYPWTASTTDAPVFVLPVGMDVTNLYFKHDCLSAGCWVVEVDYAIGEDNFNVFYLPRSSNDDTLSYDVDYTGTDLETTFRPASHPCGNDAYEQDPEDGIETTVSVCCVKEFVANYRTVRSFAWDRSTKVGCEDSGYNEITYEAIDSACFGAGKANEGKPGVFNHPDAPIISEANMPPSALSGKFSNFGTNENLEYSYVQQMGVVDPFLGIYKAAFYLDEIELRRYMGKLSGTVSVEHTVEFFVGIIDFKPNGLQSGFLDMQARQTEIVVEKTDFFTVATHGRNDYTFLRYTNLRLVETYLQDADNTDDAATDRTVRTDRAIKAQYVQVTFTLGEQYGKKDGFDVIPLDSVRVGKGTFLVENSLYHMCDDYTGGATHTDIFQPAGILSNSDLGLGSASPSGITLGDSIKGDFDYIVGQQPCAPQSQMCNNPQGVDALQDQFVAFNIPVGFDYFPSPQADLSANIFVHMVIQVENREAMLGLTQASNITKTTLSASIPVVEGGINIFCDGIVAKTDLQDVAYAKIYVGSAGFESELSRLRIIGKAVSTSSVLTPNEPQRIDSDSIEAGLMTLVVLGNSSYFTSANGMGLVLEDVYTIHIMEDDDYFLSQGCDSPWVCDNGNGPKSLGSKVYSLLTAPGEELYDSNTNQLQTDGYPLNGAFRLRVDRVNNRARLEVTAGLDKSSGGADAPCQFGNPGGASVQFGSFRQTCVLRHDVDPGVTNGPFPNGWATELPDCASDTNCDDVRNDLPLREGATPEDFMTTILGGSDLSRELGTNYSKIIRSTEKLNGIFRRAWWINPGYEWTAQQTGGQSIFTVSQKLVMFALIGLDENRGVGNNRRRYVTSISTRGDGRRADATPFTDTGRAGETALISSTATPETVLAQIAKTDVADVMKFELTMKLTTEQECLSADDITKDLSAVVKGHFQDTATYVKDVFLLDAVITRDPDAQCARRFAPRKLLMSYSQSTVALRAMVAFDPPKNEAGEKVDEPAWAEEAFQKLPGVEQANQFCGVGGCNTLTIVDDVDGLPGNNGNIPISTPGGDDEDGGSSNIGMIAGVVGGVAAVAVLGAVGFYMMKNKRSEKAMAADVVPTKAQSDIENLKAQLQSD